MAELNRCYPGGLFRVEGNYSRFLERRAEHFAARAQYQDALENKVRREIEWLRRGPKARTSKSRARIDSAGRLIDELADVSSRTRTATAQIDFTASGRRTKKLIEVQRLTKALGGKTLFRDLDLVLSPGMRLGLVGLNGTGKTSLLRLLTGEIQPDAGSMTQADALQLVYFDQNRQQVDPAVTLRRALAPHGDSVIHGDRVVHVAAWAKRFLFRPEQLDVQVGRLSGGERARVLIARLMLQPADVLLLDEPTNDLDIPTLEVLEETLTEFTGALVLVTHDRFMLDRISTHVLGLDGEGGVELYADYSQWEQAMNGRQKARSEKPAASKPAAVTLAAPAARKRLSYMEAREWEGMEARILEAETRLEACRAALEDPEVVVDGERVQRCYEEMLAAQKSVDDLYARWAELEAKQS
jgi:ATP-binding cassette subfamily F protein uup